MTARSSTPDSAKRRKSLLFCPDCDHESEIPGDWVIREDGGNEAYECPDCGVTITSRFRGIPLCC